MRAVDAGFAGCRSGGHLVEVDVTVVVCRTLLFLPLFMQIVSGEEMR
jgi:hypothetical protein